MKTVAYVDHESYDHPDDHSNPGHAVQEDHHEDIDGEREGGDVGNEGNLKDLCSEGQ